MIPTDPHPRGTRADARLRAALRPTDEDRVDAARLVDRVLEGSATSRPLPARDAAASTPRRPRWAVPLMAASVAACLALAVGAFAQLQARSPEQTAAPTAASSDPSFPLAPDADRLMAPGRVSGSETGAVTCSSTGRIRVATPVVRARRDGVHLRVTAAVPGTLFNTPDGGGSVPVGTSDVVVDATPGKVTLSCSVTGTAPTSSADLQVVDPGGSWLGGTGNLVCLGGIAQPSWVVGPATGTTRRGAVEALSARMNTDRPVASIGRAPVGYVGSATQTWTIDVTGATSGTVATVVSVRPLGPDRYEAAPDRICDRGTAGSRAAPADTPDVVDTDGTTLGGPPQLWCPAMAKLDTGAEGRGMTPRVAVLDLARRTSPGTPVEVGRAPMGPVETASQAWTLAHGRTKVTVAQVTPEETASSRFVARPDFTCGR